MNKLYEEGRKPFFSNPGETMRKQYVRGKDEKGNKKLIETEPIDIQDEIESYADECDIKNIVRKASFDPEFAKSLVDSAKTDEIMDITEWPTSIHEYHAMIATAQAKAAELANLSKMTKKASEANHDQSQENGKMTKSEE